MEASIGHNIPLSEQYLSAATEWVDKEAAADILESAKSAVMAQWQANLGDMAVNKAEQTVKASAEWMDYLKKTADARQAANLAKVHMEAMRMRFNEWQNHEANNRAEARLLT